jgi:antitoxin (DNA-binding transcriptional repressor) of toxin-antitoxin stability system
MIQTDLENAQSRLPELIEAAARGEEVLIATDNLTGHPVVQLVTVERAVRKPEFGSARGLVTLADDFDAPLPDFAEYQ